MEKMVNGTNTMAAKNTDVTMNMAGNYLKTKRTIGKFIGLGMLLCFLGAMILAFSQFILRDAQAVLLNKPNDLFGIALAVMLILIAGGTVLFLHSGKLESSYRYLEKPFHMDVHVKQQLQNNWETIKSGNKTTLIIGVCCCVLSLTPTIVGVLMRAQNIFAIGIGVCLTFIIAAVSAWLIVKAANVLDAYHKLLEMERYEPAKKKARHRS